LCRPNYSVSGKVDGNVRLVGQSVLLNAIVQGNATIIGQSFSFESAGSVGGDISVASSSSTLNGIIGRDLLINGNTSVLNSVVGRNIKAVLTDLKLGSYADVAGNISLTSQNDIAKDNGARVKGKTMVNDPKSNNNLLLD
jgi:NDP-sugar pyrophosphorylase family protein